MCCIKRQINFFLLQLLPLFSIAQSKTTIEQYHLVGTEAGYLPMSIANFQSSKQWYAEGRYNYEDRETFSFHVGKTFSRKNILSYSVTPLLGGAIGKFQGVSTGINMDLDYRNFMFSLQSQYAVSTGHQSANFFYNWSELSYQPISWIYGGVSIQHTRVYQTEPVLEPGILLGFCLRNITIPIYSFAPFKKSRYFMLGLTIEWERAAKQRRPKNTLVELTNQ